MSQIMGCVWCRAGSLARSFSTCCWSIHCVLFKALSRTHKVLALSELPFHCGKKKINEKIQRIMSVANE